jgi:hypothetical protein
MGPVLQEISKRFSRPLAPSCVPTPAAGGPGCTVIDRWMEADQPAAARLASCSETGGVTPCWKLVPAGAACGADAQLLEVDRGGATPPPGLVTAIDCTTPHP